MVDNDDDDESDLPSRYNYSTKSLTKLMQSKIPMAAPMMMQDEEDVIEDSQGTSDNDYPMYTDTSGCNNNNADSTSI